MSATGLVLCPHCDRYVVSRNSRIEEHDYRRIRCPSSSTYESHESDARMPWRRRVA